MNYVVVWVCRTHPYIVWDVWFNLICWITLFVSAFILPHSEHSKGRGADWHHIQKQVALCGWKHSAWMWEVVWSSGVSASERWWDGVWEKEWDAADVDITSFCNGLYSLVLHAELYVVLNFFCLSEWQIGIFVSIHQVAREQMFSEPKLFMWEHYKNVGNMWGSHFELW
jgi:hypothetical protein